MQKKSDIETSIPILKLLGDQTRLSMLKVLQHKECCVCEFVEALNMSQPAISQHLRKLRDAKLVKEERRGQWVFYELNKDEEDNVFVEQILHLISDPLELLQKIKQTTNC